MYVIPMWKNVTFDTNVHKCGKNLTVFPGVIEIFVKNWLIHVSNWKPDETMW